jgi:hypothetical protein
MMEWITIKLDRKSDRPAMSSERWKCAATLSAKGLRNISRENYENDFKFIVNGENHVCPAFVAKYRSNRISKYRQNDCTISDIEIEVERKDISNCCDRFLRSVCTELESMELYEILLLNEEELNEGNVIEPLKCNKLIGCSCESEIEFAASHFHVLDQSSICELRVWMLLETLQAKSLKLESEDHLYEMIWSLISHKLNDSLI